MSLASSFT